MEANPPPDAAALPPADPLAEAHTPPSDQQRSSVELSESSEKGTSPTTVSSPPPSPQKPALVAPSPADRPNGDDNLAGLLHFLANANSETLGAIAVGLCAATYLILGRVGLLLIGAFSGVVVFVTYEARNPEVSRALRREKGVDVVERLFLERRAATGETSPEESDTEGAQIQKFEDFRPETREALTSLVDAVLRDYVKWWYSPIVPSDRSFPLACRKLLTSFIFSVSNHLSRKRPADAFLDFLTNSASMVIVFFSELSSAFAELPSESKASAVDVIYNYLATNPDTNLANLLNQRQQANKFKVISEDLLSYLDKSAYNCDPARVFLREILSNVVLENTLLTCSKPEWVNGWIVYLLEAGEPDFSQAIDVGMQTRPDTSANSTYIDLDGNIGNIPMAKPASKPTRSSTELERGRRKESMAHKKKLSRAEEEMDEAMEEMRRMNQMIAEEEARRASGEVGSEVAKRLAKAVDQAAADIDGRPALPSPLSGNISPTSPTSQGEKPNDASSSGQSTEEKAQTPITPKSVSDSSSPKTPARSGDSHQFTSFDQIVPPSRDNADDEEPQKPPPLTLHNATFVLQDDTTADKARVRTKPTWDYLVQIEPATSHHPGWMIVRKYADFESLHEVLRRIATISGATAFTEQHGVLPDWRLHTRASLRGELERYLRDACWYPSLAESVGMKRFLDKDQGMPQNEDKSVFNLDTIGKNVLDVLTIAPKGAMQGGMAVVGGVTGVLGNIGLGQKRLSNPPLKELPGHVSRLSISTPPRKDTSPSPMASRAGRDSLDSQRSSIVSTQPGKIAPMDRRPSYQLNFEGIEPEAGVRSSSASDRWERLPSSSRPSNENSRASSLGPVRSPSTTSLDHAMLPPPPDEMADDYEVPGSITSPTGTRSPRNASAGHFKRTSSALSITSAKAKPARQFSQLSEQETRVAVELMFAVINEMYTLSSAWNIRRTLLAAAKSFLLRPGNPSLASIQSLMQESVLDANMSDAGIAAHLRKLRENTLPTEEERAKWPAEMSQDEKEKLRVKARALLIRSGVPAALSGVMGQAATSEALGRLFDCLQIEEVARGLMFGVMLQAVRVITH